MAVACDGNGDGTENLAQPDPTTIEEPPTPSVPLPDDGKDAREEKVLSDAQALEPLLNAFWTAELQGLYNVTFDPPDRVEIYRADGNGPCGSERLEGAGNAYYCFADGDEHVAFDLDWFEQYLIAAPGGAPTFLILAHEWGHAVQDSWLEAGGQDVWDPPHRQELNADCLAGVFLWSAIENEDIIEEAGDADAIWAWLYESGGPWLDPGTHGTSEQRIAAFTDGLQQGTDDCRVRY